MRRQPISYRDAVKILGGNSRLVGVISTAAGVGLTALSAGGSSTALSLFDLKGEVFQIARNLVPALGEKFRGLSRFSRTELIEAAHAIVVISAFFEAMDGLDPDCDSLLSSKSIKMMPAEQVALAANEYSDEGKDSLSHIVEALIKPGALPGLGFGPTGASELKTFYEQMCRRLADFVEGTAVWDELNDTIKDRWQRSVFKYLPRSAVVKYEESLRQLESDFPEIALWAHRVGVNSILDSIAQTRAGLESSALSLRSLAEAFERSASNTSHAKLRKDLVTRYSKAMLRPMAMMGELPEGVSLPAKRDIYVNPSFKELDRLKLRNQQDEWVSEPSWSEIETRTDFWTFLLRHLISTQASVAPLVVLGQPGAGKSMFTQVLAADLDPRDFTVVRVKLRSVGWDSPIQQQIEAGLHNLTGLTVSWADLVDELDTAQPVIILDGFDELLQASGVAHYDYLEKVQSFQQREAELGRPVAVIVTSRTAVADQVRYPLGSVVLRLEPFDDKQVSNWLNTWNKANPARQLPREIALDQGDLARQPLLLFMLALFNSDGGSLTSEISRAELYESLFTRFAERDVTKLNRSLSDKQKRREIELELDQLSFVAFAMFNRGRQTVSDKDLINDFSILPVGGTIRDTHGHTSYREARRDLALDVAQRLAGRFFFKLFVQHAQSTYGHSEKNKSYEFLHASFTEFLVARWVAKQLRRMAIKSRFEDDELGHHLDDDKLLHALISKAVLSVREERILDFLSNILEQSSSEDIDEQMQVIIRLFRRCLLHRAQDEYSEYRPVSLNAPSSFAIYSVNLLLLLLVAVRDESDPQGVAEIPLSVIYDERYFPSPADRLAQLHSSIRLWHAQLSQMEWSSVVRVVRLGNYGDSTESIISRWGGPHDFLFNGYAHIIGNAEIISDPTCNKRTILGDSPHSVLSTAMNEVNLLGIDAARRALQGGLPFFNRLGREALGYRGALINNLLLDSDWIPVERMNDYVDKIFSNSSGISVNLARMVISRLCSQSERMPGPYRDSLARKLMGLGSSAPEAYSDFLLACSTKAAMECYNHIVGPGRSRGSVMELIALYDLLDLKSTGSLIAPYSVMSDGKIRTDTVQVAQQILNVPEQLQVHYVSFDLMSLARSALKAKFLAANRIVRHKAPPTKIQFQDYKLLKDIAGKVLTKIENAGNNPASPLIIIENNY
ncbi:hypothetical protein [Herbidospora sp. NBRC 101105]|uniref:NACHT domain-containing protein n=1 Tax=Herbidospora sp. NBRC 101105 TaxID=3032195 RepID=UPI0024A25B9E|nr:hypothetical protein [Herbidospora sp. NBRC 101105]GLX98761.1 hypothetical protein Hesp01_67110 [Herbidospora sp. NBRC 101105]